MRLFVAPATILVAATLLPACGGGDLSGPPGLRAGRDECATCGMIISEERYACAFLIEERGQRRHVLFDDLCCMLDYDDELRDGGAIIDGWVRDADDMGWVQVDSAVFVAAPPERVRTPMGSGMLAFATPDAAAGAARQHGGEVLDREALAEVRRRWRAARFGPSEHLDHAEGALH